MKLLLDQNLSHRLINALEQVYPDSAQVSSLDLGEATDKAIWDYAKENNYAIVTLDADFHEFSLLWEGPPLIIWLKCGNQSKAIIRDKLLESQAEIHSADDNPDTWCIEIY